MKNYLPNVIKPVKEMEAIKATLVNIKGNLEKQANDWRDNWEEFNAQITKNYLPNIIKPIREMKAIKITLVDIKNNFKE